VLLVDGIEFERWRVGTFSGGRLRGFGLELLPMVLEVGSFSSSFATATRTPPPITRHATGKKFLLSVSSAKEGYFTGETGTGDDEFERFRFSSWMLIGVNTKLPI